MGWTHQKRVIERQDAEIARVTSNMRQYESTNNALASDNRVLELKLNEISYSKDSTIAELNKVRKSLKIKDKELKQAMSVKTVIRDTLTTKIPVEINFTAELKPNQLTTIKVIREDSILTCIPEIYNSQHLYTYERKEYRNKRKNFFDRLIHFDFKKDVIKRYNIVNTNELIKVQETRIIDISK